MNHPEKEARIKEMIAEYKQLEELIEVVIIQKQTRLHEHRRRREILEAIL